MGTTTVTTYPFDPTGKLASNKITNEQQIITSNNWRDYHFIVPKFAPYFADTIKVKFNDSNEELFCTFSKERIQLGEKYALLVEQMYDGEIIELPYKLENLPDESEFDSEDDELFFGRT